jgi:hypothetical protein
VKPLADDLAAVLAAEPTGLPCVHLVARLHRRRGDVLAVLRADPRFEHSGRARGSRWRLRRGRSGQMGREDRWWLALDPSGVPPLPRRAEDAP